MQLQFFSTEEVIRSLYIVAGEDVVTETLERMGDIDNGSYGFMQCGTDCVVFVGMFGWVDANAWYELCPNARVLYVANPSHERN